MRVLLAERETQRSWATVRYSGLLSLVIDGVVSQLSLIQVVLLCYCKFSQSVTVCDNWFLLHIPASWQLAGPRPGLLFSFRQRRGVRWDCYSARAQLVGFLDGPMTVCAASMRLFYRLQTVQTPRPPSFTL